jgi:class 3 adenylate cyclase
MAQRRKLAAILSADVVGYSRLMAVNEAATVETLKAYRDIKLDGQELRELVPHVEHAR